MIWDLPVEWEK